MSRGREIITRGEDGLMPIQRDYIRLCTEVGEDAAKQELDLTSRRVSRWHREDEAYRTAYDSLVSGIHTSVQQRLKAVEDELPDYIRKLLDETKEVKVTCPFDKTHKFTVTVDNAAVRAKVVEMLMKSQGHLKDVRRIEGGLNANDLSAALQMALVMARDGKSISEQARRELINRGFLEDEAVEGEFREVPNA